MNDTSWNSQRTVVRLLLRLLEPAGRDDDVGQAVAVDVADAQAVAERLGGGHHGDRVKCPRLEALLRFERGKAELAIRTADEFGLLVADEIDELRRLIADRLQNLVLLPRLVVIAGPRILVDVSGRAGKTNNKDIVPAVAVEVIDPVEEVVGVAFAVLRLRRVDFVLLLEVGPLEPVGAINDVRLAVAVDVARVGAFGIIDVRELLPLELVQLVVLSDRRNGAGQQEEH